MVISQLFWILGYIPFIPAYPVQLGLGIWILLPKNEGEKVMYLVMSDYFIKFEQKMTHYRSSYLSIILLGTLKLALIITDYCASKVSSDRLVDFAEFTEKID
jgi:hypothetical protein